jgi:hypothetical protein
MIPALFPFSPDDIANVIYDSPNRGLFQGLGRLGLKKISGEHQLGFPDGGGSLALAPSGEFCW